MELTIRPIRREEFPLLADFLYDAIYRSDPSSPLPRQIVEHPSLRILSLIHISEPTRRS